MQYRTFVELRLDAVRIGIPLEQVESVLRAAAPTPVPGSRDCLLGLLDLHGRSISVYDTRRLLGLPSRPLQPTDRFVLARCNGRVAAFVADRVDGPTEREVAPAPGYAAHASGLRGVATGDDGMLLVHDLQRFMVLEGATAIEPHA